jgi:hypothetical protein
MILRDGRRRGCQRGYRSCVQCGPTLLTEEGITGSAAKLGHFQTAFIGVKDRVGIGKQDLDIKPHSYIRFKTAMGPVDIQRRVHIQETAKSREAFEAYI